MQAVADNSIFQWLLVVVSYLMAEPNTRAIMQNLTATSIWELGRSTCRVLRSRNFRKGIDSGAAHDMSPQVYNEPDNLHAVMLAAINALSDRDGEVTIKAQRSRYEKTEMTIKVSAEAKRVTSLSVPVTRRVARLHSNKEPTLWD